MLTELIGWSSAIILLLTIGRQVYTQWRTRSTQGLSKWLFIGQLAASTGFVVYSWLLGNWVFTITNLLMLGTAAIGQWLYLRNIRRGKSGATAAQRENPHKGAVVPCTTFSPPARPWIYTMQRSDQ